MMGRTHIIVSTGITLSTVHFADIKITASLVGITIFSSIVADIDEPNSLISRTLFPIQFRLLRKIAMILAGILLISYTSFLSPWNFIIGSLLVIISLFPHRSLTHTLYALAIYPILLYFASLDTLFTLVGTLSFSLHLLCDCLTQQGIRLLPPFKRRISFNLMRTGEVSGFIVESASVIFTIFIVWMSWFYV